MARPDLKARADALRAEAAAARGQAKDAFFKREEQLELEKQRVATAKDAADDAAKHATERAAAAADAATASASVAQDLDQLATKDGDAREAEEASEDAKYARRGREVDLALERQATLDAAKFRE